MSSVAWQAIFASRSGTLSHSVEKPCPICVVYRYDSYAFQLPYESLLRSGSHCQPSAAWVTEDTQQLTKSSQRCFWDHDLLSWQQCVMQINRHFFKVLLLTRSKPHATSSFGFRLVSNCAPLEVLGINRCARCLVVTASSCVTLLQDELHGYRIRFSGLHQC